MKCLRPILIILGVSAWFPVIYMRYIKHIDLSFLQVLPYLTLHLTCMITLLIIRLKKKKAVSENIEKEA